MRLWHQTSLLLHMNQPLLQAKPHLFSDTYCSSYLQAMEINYYQLSDHKNGHNILFFFCDKEWDFIAIGLFLLISTSCFQISLKELSNSETSIQRLAKWPQWLIGRENVFCCCCCFVCDFEGAWATVTCSLKLIFKCPKS